MKKSTVFPQSSRPDSLVDNDPATRQDSFSLSLNSELKEDSIRVTKDQITSREELKLQYGFGEIIGESKATFELFELIQKVKDIDSTVFITGESGTGKELVAKALHYNSWRGNKPFVTVNCSAIPRGLLEAELFGYLRGAFTGAVTSREGRFQIANGGTIFLDEIGEIDPSIQVKLLRVIQEKKFEPVGSSETRSVDVRIIAATNKDLALAVKRSEFREDLYYRLHVIPIKLVPLRARRDDIPLLLKHFLDKYSHKYKRTGIKISQEALGALLNYSWPGNVRELENLVNRLIVLKSTGDIGISDLPLSITQATFDFMSEPTFNLPLPADGIDFKKVITDIENGLINQALERTQGNRKRAANLLGMNRTTLVEKLKKKGIS